MGHNTKNPSGGWTLPWWGWRSFPRDRRNSLRLRSLNDSRKKIGNTLWRFGLVAGTLAGCPVVLSSEAQADQFAGIPATPIEFQRQDAAFGGKSPNAMAGLIAASLPCLPQTTGLDAQSDPAADKYLADFDLLWSTLRDNYAYFDKKRTDWNRVRELYRPEVLKVKDRADFVTLLEHVLDELYDHHMSLNTNLQTSPRLVPTGLDVWAEWKHGRAVVMQLRSAFSAQQAGLEAGMEIVSVNGLPIEEAVSRRLPRCLTSIDEEVRAWALRSVLAGTHDRPRQIGARRSGGPVITYRLDLPGHTKVDSYNYAPRVEWKLLASATGYIKVNDLISDGIVAQCDAALERLRFTRGLVLDLRDIPRGGSTDVAEPILGRLISRRMGYQEVVPRHGSRYTKTVSPRGRWTYKAPIVVLVNRWTGSMGEGMAIGLDGMHRATVVGTRMAGLNGGIFNLQLPNSKISVNYPAERLNHINGTPRETFEPRVLVELAHGRYRRNKDPILAAGLAQLRLLIRRQAQSGGPAR